MAKADPRIYPTFSVKNNNKPNRLLNFPFLGIIIKSILLIPVLIELFLLIIASFIMVVMNWFVISFTGKYWDPAYTFFLGSLQFFAKTTLYFFGITDKYPGFGLDTNGVCTLNIAKPENPNKWLAIPLLGIIIRFILLIPYLIFLDVMFQGAKVALFLSWFVILFKGKLPESLYEFERDSLRVGTAVISYMLGLSDSYPSFWISMDHQTAKILLIIVGTMSSVLNTLDSLSSEASTYNSNDYNYHQYYTPPSDGSLNNNIY